MTTNKYQPVYKHNGVDIKFDEASYLASSKGIRRKDMPQLDIDLLKEHIPSIKKKLNIIEVMLPAKLLSPTQNEINFSKVLMHIAKGDTTDDCEFVCSKDLHILDGHHRHVQCLVTNPNKLVKCYIFDMKIDKLIEFVKKLDEGNVLTKSKDIKDNVVESVIFDKALHSILESIVEGYGMQAPSAVPGMGPVILGQPANAEQEGIKGSGDVPAHYSVSKHKAAQIKKYEDEENEELELHEPQVEAALNNFLANFGAAIKKFNGTSMISVQINNDGEHVNWKPMNESLDYNKRLKALKLRRDPDGIEEGKEIMSGRFFYAEELRDIAKASKEGVLDKAKFKEIHAKYDEIDKKLKAKELSEASEGYKKLEIIYKDDENELEEIIKHIQDIGNIGHSFSIVIDPDDSEFMKKFYWDGDGINRIQSIKLLQEKVNEAKTETVTKEKLHFTDASSIKDDLKRCINIPKIRYYKQIDEPFSCDTLEGITKGKAGDILMIGVDGEIYPCDQEIFKQTYALLDEMQENIEISDEISIKINEYKDKEKS